MNIVEKAEEFATKCHEGQFRKDGKTPYINHPRAVVYLLKRVGITDETILASAWLHDVMEDCDVDYDTLEEEFGLDIADIVSQLTFDSDDKDPYNFQKDLYLARLAASDDIELILIKCADRIHNTLCFINSGEVKYARKYFFKASCIFGAVKLRSTRYSQERKEWCQKMFEEVKSVIKELK